MPVESLKYFGLYSIALFVGVALYITYKWHTDNALTFSKHIASSRTAYWLFAVTSLFAQTAFWLFIAFWFIPTYHYSYWLLVLVTIGSIGQVSAALVADTGAGMRSKFHYYAACTMGLTMYVFTVWMSLTNNTSDVARYLSWISLAIMTLFIVLFLAVKNFKQRTYVYQNLYLGLFYFTVLVNAYLK